MRPLTPELVRSSFVNCSTTRSKAVPVPDLAEVDWDRLDYLGWRDPKAPARAYLVTWVDDRPVSLLLRAPSSTGGRRAAMCELCHTAHPASDVWLYVAPRAGASGRQGNTIGTYVCADLSCSLYARGLKEAAVPQREAVGTSERVERLGRRVDAFVRRVVA